MKYVIQVIALWLISFTALGQVGMELQVPSILVKDVVCSVSVVFPAGYTKDIPTHLFVNGIEYTNASLEKGVLKFDFVPGDESSLQVRINNVVLEEEIHPIPLGLSVLPPLIAILLALLLKEVISSLFIGILSGTLIMSVYGNGPSGLVIGFLSTIDTYVMNAINDWAHIAVIVFSLSIAGVVSIISKNGGMLGVVNRLEPYAKNPRSGQFVIWLMGVLIFFDDYANTLVVGNTMRPVADRLFISREKLAYLVDSTAAPVAAIAFITTWIGAELGYIETGLSHLPELDISPYGVFLTSLQYAFYPIFTLAFMLMLIYKKHDFGPMLKAELKSRERAKNASLSFQKVGEVSNEFVAKEGVVPRSFNAIIPIAIIIVGAVWGMWETGTSATDMVELEGQSFFRRLSIIIGNSDSFTALLWSSLAGLVAAVILTVSQRIMKLEETIESGLGGFKTMMPAMIILVLAWALAGITQDMHTAQFLQGLWSESLSPVFIPAVVFVLSGLVAFSTGSSWGTMAILYPLLLPASYHVAIENGMDHADAMIIFYNVVSVILAGAVFGDHCSPISDTTILSSLATSCNHLDHVKTQMPYAVTVGCVAVFMGSIPAAMGVSSFITFPLGLLVLYGIVHFFGKRTD
ncbi:MAG: Na+/H+ antiporter NhaC [Salibacteraceae bacterium]|jgi:Na+/H+ antiporter NhaC